MRRLLRLFLLATCAMLGGAIALPLAVGINLHALGSVPGALLGTVRALAPTATATPHPHRTAPHHQPARHPATPHIRASHPSHPRLPNGTTIVIPRLGIRAPVYERGVDSTGQLPIAPGYAVTHFSYSAPLGARGNYVIYGHDDIEGSIFQYLGNMRVGDRVYLYSGARRVVYRVTGRMIVSPDAVWVLDPTPTPTLTMISCTPYWVDTQRIVVKAALVH